MRPAGGLRRHSERMAVGTSAPQTECEFDYLLPKDGHAVRFHEWLAAGNSPVNLTLRDAARIAALEPHYFSAVFPRWFGESFAIWRRRQRVARAVDELKARRLSVTEVAIIAGYRNRRSLERAIRAVTGGTVGQLVCRLHPARPESSIAQVTGTGPG